MEVRCPQCHSPIDLADDTPLSDIACPFCGSSFSLLGEETLTYQAAQVKTIGHFELVDQIGIGSFGSVWRARDTELDRTVAVKIPRKGQLDPAETEQFLREARAAAQLRHPNIVSVHEVGRDEDTLYIVSDYVEGPTLADWLTDQRLTSREAAELCAKVADALHHAHEAGVVHRDLKPGNIILDAHAEPHIMDFGLAKREAGEITMTIEGKVLGTPAYASPEQAKGEAHQADRRSDVYSLGVILFESLTGERPFRGNVRMLLYHVIHDDAPSPRRYNSNIPRDLETVCLKCLEKDPRKRYASARELGEDLRRFLAGEPIRARPITTLAKAWRWCKRKPVVASLGCGLVLALLGGFAGVASQWIRAENKAEWARQQERAAQMERDRVKAAQAETVASLYRALVREARATRLSGIQGYRPDVWTSLEHAMGLDTPEKNVYELRQEAVACLGDFVGLQPIDHRGFRGHACCVALAPDGGQLAVGLVGGPIELRDAATGKLTTRLEGHTATVSAICFGAKGASLVSLDLGGTLKRWQGTGSGEWLVESTAVPDSEITFWAMTPDARFLAGTQELAAVVQELRPEAQKPSIIRIENLRAASPLAVSPGGGLLACRTLSPSAPLTATTSGFAVCEVSSGKVLYQAESPLGRLYSVAFSADAKLLAVGCGEGFLLLDTQKFERRATVRSDVALYTCFSPDSRLLAVSTPSGETLLYSISGNRLATLAHPQGRPFGLAFSADGKALASACAESVRVWNLAGTGERLVLSGHHGGIPAVKFSPDGRLLASGSKDRRVCIWDTSTGAESHQLPAFNGPVQTVAFSPDGRLLACGAQTELRIFEVGSGKFATIEDHDLGEVLAIAFSSDAKYLAASGHGSVVWRIKDLGGLPHDSNSDSLEVVLRTPGSWCTWLCFSQDSSRLAWVNNNKTVQLWHVGQSQPEMLRLPARLFLGYNNLAFYPDSTHIAFVSDARKAEVWNVNTARKVASFASPPEFQSFHLALSSDGRWLAADPSPSAIDIWDGATGEHMFSLRAERSPIWSLDWSPGARQLAVGLSDGGLVIWDLPEIRTQLAEIGLGWPEKEQERAPAWRAEHGQRHRQEIAPLGPPAYHRIRPPGGREG